MNIPYASRSRFLPKCEESIRNGREDLRDGVPMCLKFEPGGYSGRVLVNIDAVNHNEFGTDWEEEDPTRFPARIKAAATALYNCSCFGRYEIAHKDGVLTIRQIQLL